MQKYYKDTWEHYFQADTIQNYLKYCLYFVSVSTNIRFLLISWLKYT